MYLPETLNSPLQHDPGFVRLPRYHNAPQPFHIQTSGRKSAAVTVGAGIFEFSTAESTGLYKINGASNLNFNIKSQLYLYQDMFQTWG